MVREITMGEDRSRARTEKSPHAMASLRNLAAPALGIVGEKNIANESRWAARGPTGSLRLLGS